MKTNPQVLTRLAALIAAAAVVPPVAAQSKPDSTQATAQGALTPSNCPNITNQWYGAGSVPTGYYKSNANGNCYPIPACPYAWDGTTQSCVAAPTPAPTPAPAPTPVAAPSPAPTPTPAPPPPVAPSVALSLPSAAYSQGPMSATWSVSGNPMPTSVSIGCYPAAGGSLLASWSSAVPPTGGSLTVPDAMVGNDKCIASVVTSAGSSVSSSIALQVVCPTGKQYNVVTHTCVNANPTAGTVLVWAYQMGSNNGTFVYYYNTKVTTGTGGYCRSRIYQSMQSSYGFQQYKQKYGQPNQSQYNAIGNLADCPNNTWGY